jgi:hypothetical protein
MSVLHVLNGDATREKLERADIAGELAVYADVLHEGPVPATFDADAIATRSRWLADAGYGPFDVLLDFGTRWQTALDRHADYDDVVLWLEHDLFDQLLLLRHLAFFDAAQRRHGLWLISSPDYLGPMSAQQLERVYQTRAQVSPAQSEAAVRAWRAFTSDDAAQLEAAADSDTSVLPFLHDALVRMLEEYPSVRDGLGRLDRQIVQLTSEGERSPAQLFALNAKLEESIYLGDVTFWLHLQQLANATVPLIELAAEGEMDARLPEGVVRITNAGRDVAAGSQNAIALNGSDRWIGGVQLRNCRWRWDAEQRRLTAWGPADRSSA